VSIRISRASIRHRRSPEKLPREDSVGENRRVKEIGSLREYGKKRTGSRNKRNKTNLTTLLKMFLE